MENPFKRPPMPSIKAEINRLDEAEREKFKPIKVALLEEVKKTTLANAAKVQNPSSKEQEMQGAEEVKGMILGKGQGYNTPRLNLGLTGHYKTGDVGAGFSLSHLSPDDVDRIFRSLAERFDANTVNALRIKMAKSAAQEALNRSTDKERIKELETFLANLK